MRGIVKILRQQQDDAFRRQLDGRHAVEIAMETLNQQRDVMIKAMVRVWTTAR